jgi:hypothetical protein
MASCPNCVVPLQRGLALQKDLIGIGCEALGRIFAGKHDALVKQVGERTSWSAFKL